ncbi:crossover junction endodeoxyribonuclease RuvC [Candidatus Binatia bacterium]|jgi:crossover junction endodeoxyribonuclease RuvC|nr:crossover junction endodeoxyribonuclease RuvC [Candidatus Binatia bacterium]
MRVLGIDPGSRVTGWALVEASGNTLRVLAVGTAAPRTGELAARLGSIAEQVERLIGEWAPESVAVERAFVGRNVASALRLGEIRGAVLAVAGRHGLAVVDYPPATVKLAVAGSGAAEKEAVARGVSTLTGGRYAAGDATDALAVAICHVRHASFARRLRPAEA